MSDYMMLSTTAVNAERWVGAREVGSQSYREMAQQHLSQYGMSIQQAYDFLFQNLDSPQTIASVCEDFGVNTKMLAGIVGTSLDTVHGFFANSGVNYAGIVDESDDDDAGEEFDADAFYAFLMNHLQSPQSIVDEAGKYQLNLNYLAETTGLALQQVAQFFESAGVDYSTLLDDVDWPPEDAYDSSAFYNFIMEHVDSPQSIVNEASKYQLNLNQVADLVGFSVQQVAQYFQQHGVNYDGLMQGVVWPEEDDSPSEFDEDAFWDSYYELLEFWGSNVDWSDYQAVYGDDWQDYLSWYQANYAQLVDELSELFDDYGEIYGNESYYEQFMQSYAEVLTAYTQGDGYSQEELQQALEQIEQGMAEYYAAILEAYGQAGG